MGGMVKNLLASAAVLLTLAGCAITAAREAPFESNVSFRMMLYG